VHQIEDLPPTVGSQQGRCYVRCGVGIRLVTTAEVFGNPFLNAADLGASLHTQEALKILIGEADRLAAKPDARGKIGAKVAYLSLSKASYR